MNTELRQTLFMLIALAVTGPSSVWYGIRARQQGTSAKTRRVKRAYKSAVKPSKVALDQLTKERDQKQAELDELAKRQEETDNAAKLEIARLADELERRPIRVRVIAASGACGGSAPGDTSTDAKAGAGNDASASGLLPESNSRRLRAAIAEVEALSAAYSSCRKRLFSQ